MYDTEKEVPRNAQSGDIATDRAECFPFIIDLNSQTKRSRKQTRTTRESFLSGIFIGTLLSNYMSVINIINVGKIKYPQMRRSARYLDW